MGCTLSFLLPKRLTGASCPICCERKAPAACSLCCKHAPAACPDCMASYLLLELGAGMAATCMAPDCQQALTGAEVQAILTKKRCRQAQLQLRLSSGSGWQLDGSLLKAGTAQAPYAQGHVVQHMGNRAEEAQSAAYLRRRGCKLCPRCGHGISKSGGCSRMTCRCGLSFCWDCLADMRSAPRHTEGRWAGTRV